MGDELEDIIAVILIFGAPLALIIGFFAIWALKILKGNSSAQGRALQANETRLMQELHHGFMKMEKRVEALETILLDRAECRDHAEAERD